MQLLSGCTDLNLTCSKGGQRVKHFFWRPLQAARALCTVPVRSGHFCSEQSCSVYQGRAWGAHPRHGIGLTPGLELTTDVVTLSDLVWLS